MGTRGLKHLLDRYCARYRLVRGLCLLQTIALCVFTAGALYVLVDRLVYVGVPASLVLSGAACVGLLVLLGSFLFGARRRETVSYLVDHSAGLKNLVFSASSVENDDDDVARVLVGRASRELETRRPGRVMPFRLTRGGRFLYVPVTCLVGALFLPSMDLLSRRERRDDAEAERVRVESGVLKLAAAVRSIDTETTSAESIDGKAIDQDFNALAKDLRGITQKEALLKLGEFENRYREDFANQRDFAKSAQALQSSPKLSDVPAASRDALRKLSERMKNNDFKGAGEAMRDLAQQLRNKELSQEERKALARELARMTKDLQGCPSGGNLDELLRKLESSPEDIADLLKQCDLAGKDLEEMARFCESCDNLQSMQDGLKQAKKEMLGEGACDFDAKEVEAYLASEACLGGNGIGLGTGGEGKGKGGLPLENRTETTFSSKLSPGTINRGKILHQLFVRGVPEKGEALIEYTDVVRAAKQDAAGSLARDRIPREREQMVKAYFDSLELGDRGGGAESSD